jgi:hypothetical protein
MSTSSVAITVDRQSSREDFAHAHRLLDSYEAFLFSTAPAAPSLKNLVTQAQKGSTGGLLLRKVADAVVAGTPTTGPAIQQALHPIDPIGRAFAVSGMMKSLNAYYRRTATPELVANRYIAKENFPTYTMSIDVARAVVEVLDEEGALR